MQLFLDANAHLPINTKTLQIYTEFSSSIAGHGHPLSPSKSGRLAAKAIEESRRKIANLIGAKNSSQIIFTTGATQGCEWGLKILSNLNKNIAVSQLEHNAVLDAIDFSCAKKIENDCNGAIIVRNYDAAVCVHLQNEIGTIQLIKELKQNCSYLFSDMSQSLGKISVNVTELDVDIAIFSSHKFGGSSGVGFMYLKNTEHWLPFGTGSRYCLDITGTPNTAGIIISAFALEEAINTLEVRTKNMIIFRDIVEKGLEELGFEIIGKNANRSPNTTFVCMPGKSFETLLKLENYDIFVGLGSACGSLHSGPSKTIKALGRSGDIYDYMRISQWGEYGADEAEYFIDSLRKIL